MIFLCPAELSACPLSGGQPKVRNTARPIRLVPMRRKPLARVIPWKDKKSPDRKSKWLRKTVPIYVKLSANSRLPFAIMAVQLPKMPMMPHIIMPNTQNFMDFQYPLFSRPPRRGFGEWFIHGTISSGFESRQGLCLLCHLKNCS